MFTHPINVFTFDSTEFVALFARIFPYERKKVERRKKNLHSFTKNHAVFFKSAMVIWWFYRQKIVDDKQKKNYELSVKEENSKKRNKKYSLNRNINDELNKHNKLFFLLLFNTVWQFNRELLVLVVNNNRFWIGFWQLNG